MDDGGPPPAQPKAGQGGSIRERLLAIAEEFEMLEARCEALKPGGSGPLDAVEAGAPIVCLPSCHSTGFANDLGSEEASVGIGSIGGKLSISDDTQGHVYGSKAHRSVSAELLADARCQLRAYYRSAPSSGERSGATRRQSITVNRPSVSRQDTLAGSQDVGIWATGHRLHALDPNSTIRLLLDAFLLLICMHDTAVVPFVLAWDVPPTPYTRTAEIISLTFWVCDIIMNFATGFVKDGIIVVDFRRIAVRYLTNAFPFDFTVTFIDLVTICMDSLVQGGSMDDTHSRSLKVLRILKLNKLARATVIFQRSIRKIKLRSNSWTLLGLGGRLVAIVICMNHLISCAWFWLGQMGQRDLNDTGASWLDMRITSGGLTYKNADREFQYLTSFHWALTQMTPGSMSVVPQNSYERGWNVLCLVMGLFVSSLLISQLSAKMVRVQTLNHENLVQMDLLCRFLSEQCVPRSLAARIQRQVSERAALTKPLTRQDLPSLQQLPMTLRNELACAIFAPSFLRHNLFYALCIWDETLIEALAMRAAELEAYSPDDELFAADMAATKCYVLQMGSFEYVQRFGMSDTDTNFSCQPVKVSTPNFVSTIALFCDWTYVGTLTAVDASEMVALCATTVIEILKANLGASDYTYKFAQAYAVVASAEENAHLVDLDLEPAKVMMAMDIMDRNLFCKVYHEALTGSHEGHAVARYMPSRARVNQQQAENLCEELDAGKCVLTFSADFQPLRTVLLSALHIRKPTGELLMQLASCKRGELEPDFVFPGSKLRSGESADKAARRVVEEELPEIGGSLKIISSSEEEQIKKSAQHGIRTAYLKTVFEVSYREIEDSDGLPLPSETGPRLTIAGVMPESLGGMLTTVMPIVRDMGDGKYQLFAWLKPVEYAMLLKASSTDPEFRTWLKDYHESREWEAKEQQRRLAASTESASSSSKAKDMVVHGSSAEIATVGV